MSTMNISLPEANEWKHSVAEVYSKNYERAAQEFLAFVVAPSLDALERRLETLWGSGEAARIAFESQDHLDLIDKTSGAFCLSIQSRWERQLRRYISMCPNFPRR